MFWVVESDTDVRRFLIQFWENDPWLGKKDLALSLIAASRFTRPRLMEVGLWQGGWSLHVAKNAGIPSVTAIDPYPGLEAVRAKTMDRFASTGIHLDLFRSWSECGKEVTFDVVHVDGEHSEESALKDLTEASSHLSAGGIIIVDDWLQPAFLGVNSAVHRFLSARAFRIVLTTEWKAYLASESASGSWRHFFGTALADNGRIPYRVNPQQGLGDYIERQTVLDAEVIISIGKPTGQLVEQAEGSQLPKTIRALTKMSLGGKRAFRQVRHFVVRHVRMPAHRRTLS